MNIMRFAIRISFIVLVSMVCTLAMAQVEWHPSDASVRQADSHEHRLFKSAAEGENVNRVPPNDGLQWASSMSVLVSDLMAPAPDEPRSTAPSITDWQEDSHDGCCSTCCNNPCPSAYLQVEALFMQREPRFNRQSIVVDPNTSTTFVSTSDLDFDFDPGLRATVGMRLCGGRALEFTYFGLLEGNSDAVAASTDPAAFLTFPDNLFGNVFVDPDRVGVNYASRLNSFELNLPCCCGCCDQCCNGCCEECCDQCRLRESRCQSVEWFTGFRYVNLGEELHILAERIVAGGLEEGSYDVRTTNHLYGVQFGVRERHTRGRFGWEATGKAGIFANDAHQAQSVTDFPNFQLRPTVSTSGGQVAFIGDANLSALYRLTDIWNLRAGYNAIWIEGLALAPDQLDFDFASSTGGNRLHTGGGMFLHGVNVGVEARW